MRFLARAALTAAIVGTAGAAAAQDGQAQCRGLGLLVDFGVINAGDTAALRATARGGDSAACAAAIADWGYSPAAVDVAECAGAINLIADLAQRNAAPADAPGLVEGLLLTPDGAGCAATLADLGG